MAEVAGFSAVLDGAGGIQIQGNPVLAFAQSSQQTALTFANNARLVDLSGFVRTATVRYLELSNNASLSTLSALDALVTASTLRVQNNAALPTCVAEQSRERLSGLTDVTIQGNNPNCPP